MRIGLERQVVVVQKYEPPRSGRDDQRGVATGLQRQRCALGNDLVVGQIAAQGEQIAVSHHKLSRQCCFQFQRDSIQFNLAI